MTNWIKLCKSIWDNLCEEILKLRAEGLQAVQPFSTFDFQNIYHLDCQIFIKFVGCSISDPLLALMHCKIVC